MKRGLILSIYILLLSIACTAQPAPSIPNRLKVFVDCSDTWCDTRFIRSEINLVDFLLDNKAADVHILITSQGTGSGGDQYQLIFFGQNQFSRQPDTLHFNTDPNITDFEERDVLIRYIKLGLAPFIARTKAADNVSISFKTSSTDSTVKEENKPVKDPWNYWVFRLGANGYVSGEEAYRDSRLSGSFSANRITDDWKIGFNGNADKNRQKFIYEDSLGTVTDIVNKKNINLSHFLIKSINTRWSWAYEVNYSQSIFSNIKSRAFFRTAIEYNLFPYKEVNNKLVTLSYGITARKNKYFDSTIYNKTAESLLGHRVDVNLTYNQKWGSSYLGIYYHNYFHNWKFYNLSLNAFTDVRVTGGLTFYLSVSGGLTRDQLYIKKGLASTQEVLTRQRQLASNFSYFTSIGISYRFGSKLNNFVNPRFDGETYNNY
jgi:hypothetical protein